MQKKYQYDYSLYRQKTHDKNRGLQKARRAIKFISYYFKNKKLSSLKLLDVGCSTGIIDYELSKKFKKVVGIDIDKPGILLANSNYKRKNLEFKLGDAMNLKFKDSSFHVVVCMHIYEHVPDDAKLFREIYRVLKPGGICYFAAVNKLWPLEPHHNLLFLSWLPKSVAHQYFRICKKGNFYYETLKTYWGLKRLTKIFLCHDYTSRILRTPKIFGFDDILPQGSLKAKIMQLASPLAKYFSPTFFWVLEK